MNIWDAREGRYTTFARSPVGARGKVVFRRKSMRPRTKCPVFSLQPGVNSASVMTPPSVPLLPRNDTRLWASLSTIFNKIQPPPWATPATIMGAEGMRWGGVGGRQTPSTKKFGHPHPINATHDAPFHQIATDHNPQENHGAFVWALHQTPLHPPAFGYLIVASRIVGRKEMLSLHPIMFFKARPHVFMAGRILTL